MLAANEEVDPGDSVTLLVFRSAESWLAIPTSMLVEVVEARPIHRVPHRVAGLLRGLVNIRGRLSPCVDIRRLLSIEGPVGARARRETCRLVVADGASGGGWIAFEADEVVGVHVVPDDWLRGLPSTVDRGEGYFQATFRWHEYTVGVLDPGKFLDAMETFDQ